VAVSGGKVRRGVGYLLIVPAFGGGDGVVAGLFVFRVENTQVKCHYQSNKKAFYMHVKSLHT
jgi:hypothetical protein